MSNKNGHRGVSRVFTAAGLVTAGLLGAAQAKAEAASAESSVATSVIQPAEAQADGSETTVAASDAAANDGGSEWGVQFTPYLWMAGIKGDIGIPKSEGEVDIDRSFSDTLGDLKFAFMGTMDADYRRFVIHTDVIYLNLGASVERPDSLIFTEGEADMKMLIATGAMGYRVVDQGLMFVDLYAGARLVSLDVDLALEGPLQTREAGISPSNLSPLIGGKARFPLGDRWALAVQGDIGFDSDVKWQLAGTVQYDISRRWRAGLGYRHLALHHDKNEGEVDISLSGPLLAFTYSF